MCLQITPKIIEYLPCPQRCRAPDPGLPDPAVQAVPVPRHGVWLQAGGAGPRGAVRPGYGQTGGGRRHDDAGGIIKVAAEHLLQAF